MTKKLTWRLSKLPTPEELVALVKEKIITQEEAKEILLSTDEKNIKDLENEIKFLREVVDKLSEKSYKVVETIRLVEKPYYNYTWYNDYNNLCQSGSYTINVTGDSSGAYSLSSLN